MSSKPRIVLICTGLGRVNRGFEQYIAQLAQQLAKEGEWEARLEVWSGGSYSGKGVKSKRIWNASRQSGLLRKKKNAFQWEQRTFFIGMLPFLWSLPPGSVLYLGEYELYCYLFKWRRLVGLRYKLMLYTGAYAIPGPRLFDDRLDFIHHVNKELEAAASYLPANRQRYLPHFVDFNFEYVDSVWKELHERANGKAIVLCVGAIEKNYKRTHILAEAMARCSHAVFPVFLGAHTKDWEEIQSQLEQQFGNDGYLLRTVDHYVLGSYYAAADLLLHAALKEIFGLVFIEAIYHGLPVLTQYNLQTASLLDQFAIWINTGDVSSTASDLDHFLGQRANCQCVSLEAHRHAVTNFSWASLKADYTNLFRQVLKNENING